MSEQQQSGKSFRSFLGIEPSKPSTKDSVFVIIDAQNEYAHGSLAISSLASSRSVIHSVLQKYRRDGGDIVHIRHVTPKGAPLFTQGSGLDEEFEELREGMGEGEKVITKNHPSAFTGTDLQKAMEGFGKKKIVLAGYMAHVCISGTSRAGAELGYDMCVLSDGIGDRDIPGATAKQLVDTVLAELGDVSATIISSKDL